MARNSKPARKAQRTARREGRPLPEGEVFRTGTVQEFLDLSDEDMAVIEVKLALVMALRRQRRKKGLTQTQLAKLMGSSQSRVAAMENGNTSLELLVRALGALGASKRDIGREIAKVA